MNPSLSKALAKGIPAAIAAGVLLASPTLGAQEKAAKANANQRIVGVWRLVSDSNTGADGVKKAGAGFGDDPKGIFIFMRDGRYASINTRKDLPKFASGNRLQGTAEENKAIVQGSIAHFGTYSLTPDGKLLTLKPEAATWPAWVGVEQKRNLTIKGDQMKYTLAASFGGTSELIYKRAR
jgi:hypothetical protein